LKAIKLGGNAMKQHDGAVTDLEGAVLGVLASDGWQTTYSLARTFAASPSEFWSGSAGAIYPLMTRLERRNLVAGRPCATGKRKATEYQLTASGRTAFERWLLDADRATNMGFDPLRTRLLFLGSVDAARRKRFLRAVTEKTRLLHKADMFPNDSPRVAAIHRSWFAARLAWLKTLAVKLG
jgi:DNA-binding PadR family transcriptional regulator